MAALLIDYYGGLGQGSLQEADEALQDRYLATFEDREAWAEEMLAETGMLSQVPEALRPYLDYERYARDQELSGDFIVLEGGQGGQNLIVFWSR